MDSLFSRSLARRTRAYLTYHGHVRCQKPVALFRPSGEPCTASSCNMMMSFAEGSAFNGRRRLYATLWSRKIDWLPARLSFFQFVQPIPHLAHLIVAKVRCKYYLRPSDVPSWRQDPTKTRISAMSSSLRFSKTPSSDSAQSSQMPPREISQVKYIPSMVISKHKICQNLTSTPSQELRR